MDRATVFGTVGWGFDSLLVHFLKSLLDLAFGPRFKPREIAVCPVDRSRFSIYAGANGALLAMSDNSHEFAADREPPTLWHRVTAIGPWMLVAVIFALIGFEAGLLWPRHQTDSRLWGTWQSDADRTIANMLGDPPHDEQRVAKLRNLFGKLRVTWTATHCTSDLEGTIDSDTYEVVGRDQYSVAIRSTDSKPSPLDALQLELSSLQVIHFEGRDTYWLDSQLGGMREYFKRVR